MNQFTFRRALAGDGEKIHSLYERVKGGPFCVWDTEYPGWTEIRQDLAAGCLYVLTSGEALAGAISLVPENELDALPCWHFPEGREIARVAVAPEFQGRGLALEMVRRLLELLRDCPSVRLAVAKGHRSAYRTYEKAGFRPVGEEDLFGHWYVLMEREGAGL